MTCDHPLGELSTETREGVDEALPPLCVLFADLLL